MSVRMSTDARGSAGAPAVAVESLTKRFGDLLAVDDVSFDVADREIFGIIGPNGAGKTTLMECLEGLQRRTSGAARVLGADPDVADRSWRARVGVQLQSSALPTKMKVGEAIDLFGSFYDNPRGADELIAELGLSGKKDSYVEKLSGGQRQRVSIALALVSRPEIVFLDELTTALDPQARLAMWDVVRSIRDAGCTVVMTTHYMEEAEALCDRVAIVDRGRIIALDTVAGLVAGFGGASLVTLKTNRPVGPEIFANVAGVSNVAIDGLTVRLHSTGGFPGEAVRAIEGAGAAVEEIETSKASLEDVFLALTGRAMREGN